MVCVSPPLTTRRPLAMSSDVPLPPAVVAVAVDRDDLAAGLRRGGRVEGIELRGERALRR